jgi:predicted metal-binding transcription factor (methanogenesis marker protein 9)
MESYEIVDVEKFVESTRTLVYHQFGNKESLPKNIDNLIESLSKEEVDEMNGCLTQSESLNILQKFTKKQKNKHTQQTRIKISDDDYMLYVEELNSRMISNMLVKLASEDFLETAFDEEINDFVFWAKDNNEKK